MPRCCRRCLLVTAVASFGLASGRPSAAAVAARVVLAADGTTDVDEQVAAAMNDLRMVLGTIGNEASAEAARPRLDEIRSRLDALDPRVAQLPPEARASLANLVDRSTAEIRGLAERVLALRGAEGLRLNLEPIIARLNGWARRQA